jgi:hypothetical protein
MQWSAKSRNLSPIKQTLSYIKPTVRRQWFANEQVVFAGRQQGWNRLRTWRLRTIRTRERMMIEGRAWINQNCRRNGLEKLEDWHSGVMKNK